MKSLLFKTIFALFFLMVLGSPAQTGPSNGNDIEVTFLRQAYLNSLWKLETGKIAVRQTETTNVKNFAQRMVSHSSLLCDELSLQLKKKGISPPKEFDSTQKDTLVYLSRQRGAGIDREYMSMAGDDLAADLSHYRKALPQLKDPDLRLLAEKTMKGFKEDSVLADRTLRSIPPPVLK
jgi:predicted outer membrane protein